MVCWNYSPQRSSGRFVSFSSPKCTGFDFLSKWKEGVSKGCSIEGHLSINKVQGHIYIVPARINDLLTVAQQREIYPCFSTHTFSSWNRSHLECHTHHSLLLSGWWYHCLNPLALLNRVRSRPLQNVWGWWQRTRPPCTSTSWMPFLPPILTRRARKPRHISKFEGEGWLVESRRRIIFGRCRMFRRWCLECILYMIFRPCGRWSRRHTCLFLNCVLPYVPFWVEFLLWWVWLTHSSIPLESRCRGSPSPPKQNWRNVSMLRVIRLYFRLFVLKTGIWLLKEKPFRATSSWFHLLHIE